MSKEKAFCFIGTVFPEKNFNEINLKSKRKTATSPVIMQNHIYKSFVKNGVYPTVYSYPPVSAFPGSKLLITAPKKVYAEKDMPINVLPIINIPLLKQITVFFFVFAAILFWSVKNSGKTRNVLIYADFLEYTLPAILIGKLFGNNTSLYLTELPGYEHYYGNRRDLKSRIVIWAERLKIKTYKFFKGYVFVSEPLKKLVNKDKKPSAVIEGFCDESTEMNEQLCEKEKIPTAMYAGGISKVYNINTLIDAFLSLKGDYRLWIYGSGEDEEYVKEKAKEDSRIKYFGRVAHKEVIEAEKKAHFLLHLKTDSDEHSKYAFSSKIIEYMYSGTPVLTTVVGGVPKEYYEYAFVASDSSEEGIVKSLKELFETDVEILSKKGNEAKKFVKNKKGYLIQGKKIIGMFSEMENEKEKKRCKSVGLN